MFHYLDSSDEDEENECVSIIGFFEFSFYKSQALFINQRLENEKCNYRIELFENINFENFNLQNFSQDEVKETDEYLNINIINYNGNKSKKSISNLPKVINSKKRKNTNSRENIFFFDKKKQKTNKKKKKK